jgi:hypothetical protein
MKRHIHLVNEYRSAITHPAVRAVQLLVADSIAGFCGETDPNAYDRAYAAAGLRRERRANWARVMADMRLTYLRTENTDLLTAKAMLAAAENAYVAGSIDGRAFTNARDAIYAKVA